MMISAAISAERQYAAQPLDPEVVAGVAAADQQRDEQRGQDGLQGDPDCDPVSPVRAAPAVQRETAPPGRPGRRRSAARSAAAGPRPARAAHHPGQADPPVPGGKSPAPLPAAGSRARLPGSGSRAGDLLSACLVMVSYAGVARPAW